MLVIMWTGEWIIIRNFAGNEDWDMRYFEGSLFYGHKGKSLFNLIYYVLGVDSSTKAKTS